MRGPRDRSARLAWARSCFAFGSARPLQRCTRLAYALPRADVCCPVVWPSSETHDAPRLVPLSLWARTVRLSGRSSEDDVWVDAVYVEDELIVEFIDLMPEYREWECRLRGLPEPSAVRPVEAAPVRVCGPPVGPAPDGAIDGVIDFRIEPHCILFKGEHASPCACRHVIAPSAC